MKVSTTIYLYTRYISFKYIFSSSNSISLNGRWICELKFGKDVNERIVAEFETHSYHLRVGTNENDELQNGCSQSRNISDDRRKTVLLISVLA
jgi:hypothetical protein